MVPDFHCDFGTLLLDSSMYYSTLTVWITEILHYVMRGAGRNEQIKLDSRNNGGYSMKAL